MESSSYKLQQEREKQDEIRKQIALLQAQLVNLPDDEPGSSTMIGVKRRQESIGTTSRQGKILAPPTPSPKKKRKLDLQRDPNAFRQVSKSLDFKSSPGHSATTTPLLPASTSKRQENPRMTSPAPSNLVSKLAAMATGSRSNRDDILCDDEAGAIQPSRSTSFTDAAASVTPKRDEDLTIIDDLVEGPYEHKPPLDDAKFERLEPHSGIRLLSRSISHEDICEYLRGRFYLSPSKLYSCIRLSPDKQTYDVPVPGDWVTIAVVAELGEVKYTRPPVALGPDEDKARKTGKPKNGKGKAKEQQQGHNSEENPAKSGGKRYINIRLVDFGARSGGSETGGSSVIRGDAFLSLLLFESDKFDWLEPGDDEPGGKSKKRAKIYQGGSKGAFEAMHKIRQGDVIALLNPRVLKPFQRNSMATSGNYPATNMLAVTPENAGAIVLVGRARDLSRCNARKKDGSLCSSWCDTRVSEVCEWHMQRAVESRRAGRAEFSAGTMGMSTSASRKGKRREAEFDPDKQWGLLPTGLSTGGSTYVLSGHVVSSSQADIFVGERMGREAQARAQRKAAGQEVDRALKQLIEKDKDGMRSVLRAREAGGINVKEGKKSKGKEIITEDVQPRKRQGYSASVIKGVGFDPASLSVGGNKKAENCVVADKLDELAKLQATRQERGFDLKPRPGERVRSGVVAPNEPPTAGREVELAEALIDLDDL